MHESGVFLSALKWETLRTSKAVPAPSCLSLRQGRRSSPMSVGPRKQLCAGCHSKAALSLLAMVGWRPRTVPKAPWESWRPGSVIIRCPMSRPLGWTRSFPRRAVDDEVPASGLILALERGLPGVVLSPASASFTMMVGLPLSVANDRSGACAVPVVGTWGPCGASGAPEPLAGLTPARLAGAPSPRASQ